MITETATREELYQLGRRRGLPVTRRQSRTELLELLSGDGPGGASGDERDPGDPGTTDHGGDGQARAASRVEAFTELARRRAAGEMVMLPRMLTGGDRRVHVRQTIREDHQTRIATHDEEAREKFDALAGSVFLFFRGTALLFYRDMAGEDAWMPTVLAAGDAHPENFGVVPNRDDVPVFGIDDYDEAAYAPFTWDLKRAATGFVVAAASEGGKGASKQRSIAEALVRGYAEAIAAYAVDATEAADEVRRDNAPPVIADLLDHAVRRSRAEYLTRKYLDETGAGFAASEKVVPVSSRREEFQELVDRYVRECGIQVPERAAGMRVRDVAVRKGQGTASLGLARYYLLIEGAEPDGTADVLLEVKQARPSALAGLVPPSDYGLDDTTTGHGARIAHAQRVVMANAGAFYGSVEHEGTSYLVRERAWYRDDVQLADLSTARWHEYARVCGHVLAQAHAMSDEKGRVDHDVEPAITAAMSPLDLFVADVVDFAVDAAERLRRDHEHYRADHALGAFTRVDVVYR